MATQQSLPNQVLVGLALFLTFFIMARTYRELNDEALQSYIRNELTLQEAWEAGAAPVHTFMYRQIRTHDNINELALFVDLADVELPIESAEDLPLAVLIPAHIISELKIAFEMDFYIYILFLIFDMVVASTLMAMGMMMLPPVFVSLLFKILLFVLVDGWFLLTGSLVRSFTG
jgi:flagellar biosynthetic protein FliP